MPLRMEDTSLPDGLIGSILLFHHLIRHLMEGREVIGHAKTNFTNGLNLSPGQHTLFVTMLEPNGNLKNPPLGMQVNFSYQSQPGGYQSGGGSYQSGGGNYQSASGNDEIHILFPSDGGPQQTQVDQFNDQLLVVATYGSSGGTYQTPKWAYRVDSPFPSNYQSARWNCRRRSL